MKRTLLFIACVITSITMLAQGSSYFDYLPFMEDGKVWNVFRSDGDSGCHLERYQLINEEIVKDGKTYMKMYRSEDDMDVVYDTGLFREEGRKVYRFDSEMQKEILMFDYSLKEGDTYETYSYGEQKMVTYKVLSVGDYAEGPEVVRNNYNERTDSTTAQRRYLRKWTVCRADDESLQKTWIEGAGSLEGPLENLYDARPVSSCSNLAYVNYGGDYYDYLFLPFSFHDGFGQTYGCFLPTGAADHSDWHNQLTYELEGDRLHVYGKVYTQCGPNNYIVFMEEPTDDPLVHKLRFVIQEAEPIADCAFLHATDFYVSGFDPNMSYIVVDHHGVEYPVINKTPQLAYRPMIEDGKVWKVGYESGNPVQRVEYYYIAGDTIAEGKICKRMMCQSYVSPSHPDYDVISRLPSLRYVGAWYEENQKVYFYNANKQFLLMYDFSTNANDTLRIGTNYYVVGQKQTGGIKGFKGVYRDVLMPWRGEESIYNNTWLEGVGSIEGPLFHVYYGKEYHGGAFLMSCTVGEEVIYLNDEYEDGVTPDGARKRFDFTHTVKTKPQAPMAKVAEKPLYGEYNAQQLDINLNPLDDAYLVRIASESGKVVYEKTINAGSIVGLNIDISSYAKGRYTVTVENGHESYTGAFEAQTTGISDTPRLNRNEEIKSNSIYNLQGQRISSLRKGLNIVNGQKVYVK